jgi:hypothetical protein
MPTVDQRVKGNSLEYLVISSSPGWSNHVDFARLDPVGEFFLRRILQDDGVPGKVTPGTAIDPAIMILRVAEAMAVGIAFAKALGWSPEETKLGFAFRCPHQRVPPRGQRRRGALATGGVRAGSPAPGSNGHAPR